MENLTNTLLPPDLMLEIFLLLPLESILACKLVSKDWNKLVKHPTFIKLYHNKSSTFFLTGNTLNCLFRPDDDDNTSYKVRRVPIDLTQHRPRDVTVRYPKLHELLPESSNKIACVRARNGNFLLYNFFTGDSHVVVDAPLRHYYSIAWLCYGFGYDHYEDDYKIVVVCDSNRFRIFMNVQEGRFGRSTHVSSLIFVYSYGNRVWKSFDGFPHDAYYWRTYKARAYSFKDALHWVVYRRNSKLHGERVAVALDIHSNGFVEILLPPLYYDDSSMKPLHETLTELDGNLCCCSYGLCTFDVWVMKEYGVPESWTRLFSISTSRKNGPLYCAAHYQCKDHASNVVVFLCYDNSMELFRYDIDKDEIQVFSRQKGKTRVMLKRLRAKFKKAWCFLGD